MVPAAKEITHLPIAVDPLSCNLRRPWVKPMALAAAAGCDSVMLEVHPDPENSADPLQPIDFQDFEHLMIDMNKIANNVNRWY